MRMLCALCALLSLGCDRVRSLPIFETRSTRPPAMAQIASGPWLLDPGPTQITVAWNSDAASVGRVWYGASVPDRLATEEGAPVSEHRVLLGGLQPSTQYRYRVEGSQETSWFTSAPRPGSTEPLQILVYGDNRTNGGDHALLARAAASERAVLALHTGDMVENARDEALWRTWFQEEHDLLVHMPFVPTVGNHELTDSGVTYSRYFQRRGSPPYGSLDYGPLHICVLDSYETESSAAPRDAGVSDAQREWLLEDLRGLPAERHVWVLVHQGPYSHPAHARPGHGPSEPIRAAISAARSIHPVEAVFAGHEHFYERGQVDGLPYFVLGGGGAPVDDPDARAAGVQAASKSLSYAMLDVCGCHVSGNVKDISGKAIDTFKLADCATPCGRP